MIKVRWLNTDPLIASARLRSLIPAKHLADRVTLGNDVIIAAKHGWNAHLIRRHAKRMIMDVCDDHFDNKHGPHYLTACQLADVVTCNSKTMQQIIKDRTGRDSIVIDDPYEDPELKPTSGKCLLWFGHHTNLPALQAIADRIKYPTAVVSSHNYDKLDSWLKACRAVIIPTDHRKAKSANRAIRAIRYGKYPVCGDLPAYAEIGLGKGDFWRDLDYAMTQDTTNEVLSLQRAIRERFCPEKVSKDWWRVISEA